MENINQYLSTEEFASALGITPQYARILIKNNNIPSMIVGKFRFVGKSILDDKEFVFQYSKNVKDQKYCDSQNRKYIALSFFSGAMGLDIGLEKAGIELSLASEIDPSARKTILLNKPNIGLIGDICEYSAEQIRDYAQIGEKEDIDLVIGGPPCQAFSTAGKRLGFEDARGNVFLTFIDRIIDLNPKLAVIENVRGLLSAKLAGDNNSSAEIKGSALIYIIKRLSKAGYGISFNLYNAANFGSPQKRERVVMFCSRDGKKVPYLQPTHSEFQLNNLPKWKTVRDAFENLDDSNPECLTFPEKRLKFYRLLKPGQCWKNLPEELQREAMGSKLELGGGKTGFLRRLDWDTPSPTLVTDPTMPATDLCHPIEDRPLSINEYKRIQEFPEEWRIFGSTKDKYRQIGNAVPISLGQAIGKHVVKLLDNVTINNSEYQNFPYSRYTNTTEESFVMEYDKQYRKCNKSADTDNQLNLF